ncbi:hypothetical protein BGX33_007446 [Mortierella sp. NVP41]|nr:hypothetical protein BGX33_007446 [Mortierella sp. NVP41]
MLIPDVLYLIAPNFDNRSLVACLQTRPETLFERQLSLLTKYGRHIRDLRIEHVWMTFIVLYAKPTQLRSVSFKTHSSYYKVPESMELEFDVPASIFTGEQATEAASETKMNRTRACWQLLLDNPNLERVEFTGLVEDNLIALVSANTNDDECSMPRSDGKAFLIKTVSGLTKLGHLQIGGIAGDYLLPRLATFPRITSFVYSGEGDPWSGLDVVPSLTLFHLRCRSDTSIPNLRSIIQAFPDLRSLTLNIIRGVERSSPLPKEIVHTHLERVAGTTMFCLLQANVRFPKVRFVMPSYIAEEDTLVRYLHTFPAMESLHLRPRRELGPAFMRQEQENGTLETLDSLRSLTIGGASRCDLSTTWLAPRLTRLVYLKLDQVSPETVVGISKTYLSLEHLLLTTMAHHLVLRS